MTDRERFDQVAREHLSPRRYLHSLAVAKQAVWLAKELGADPEKAEIAGILHDICKEMPRPEQLQYLSAHGILLNNLEKEAGAALHGLTASVWVREELHYCDGEVLSAIRYHTTARPAMTLLEKIVYTADLTSEDREFPDLPRLLEYLPHRIDDCVAEILSKVLTLMLRDGAPILPVGVEAYNYYILLRRGKKRSETEDNG